MAVEVIGTDREIAKYAGEDVTFDADANNRLLVYSAETDEPLAIYACGCWRSAHVVED